MNRTFSPLLKLLFVAVCAISTTLSVAASAEDKKPDATKGEALYTNGDPGRNILACVSCHGAAGNSTITTNPRLAGQHAAYLSKQLHEFATPGRANPIMTPMAKALSEQDIANIAAYLSAQTPKPGAAKDKEAMELGKHIWRAGIAAKNVPACAGCHSPNGAGIPAQYPRLAGQHQDYTVGALSNFRSGARSNSPQMMTISERLSDKEIKAVADYIAGLR